MKFSLIPLYLFSFILLSGALSSCKDIIEPSLKGRTVNPQAPANNYQSATYTTDFWWDEMDDALKYRLQVVSPKFDSAGYLALDTVIKVNKFAINLSPGQYQWRVRAENGSSQSPYSQPRSFTIFYSSIKQQKVKLGSPAGGSVTNQSSVTFQWGDLYGATKYRLQVDTNGFANESALVYTTVIPGLGINFNVAKDQTYQWRVRAENDTAQAQWSAISQFTYDHTPPNKPTLSLPANNQTVGSPVTLQWNITPTAVKYRLFVLKADGTTTFSSAYPALLGNVTTYQLTLSANPGTTVYWKVSAIDAAGNEGAASDPRSFILQ